ncbi:hypothetical protein DFH08DRAFT_177566 [Mycena albidolilacea]|uniref:Secreted protein n=1 Tax=Mycena albidolilacea TaxID=1033008 RepID=A0AAD7ARX5_9AGAR|nr:hypothetical protein DFH08DRAFT_177566 [Mycena albidolilacea]
MFSKQLLSCLHLSCTVVQRAAAGGEASDASSPSVHHRERIILARVASTSPNVDAIMNTLCKRGASGARPSSYHRARIKAPSKACRQRVSNNCIKNGHGRGRTLGWRK